MTTDTATAGTDQLDRTAQQVRLDYKTAAVHTVITTGFHPSAGRIYHTRCDDALTRVEGAILTTRPATCHWCTSGERRSNR